MGEGLHSTDLTVTSLFDEVLVNKTVDGIMRTRRTPVQAFTNQIFGLVANVKKVYSTRAEMEADLTPAAKDAAWVMLDPVAANNGVYKKLGASGSGSWLRVGNLPYSWIPVYDVGAGTANAIQVTSVFPTSPMALRISTIFRTNTGNVTISENGGPAQPLLTQGGNQISPGGLVPGILMYLDTGTAYRLLSDQASSAVLAAAEAFAVRAEAAAAAATATSNPTVLPSTAALAATTYATPPAQIIIDGWPWNYSASLPVGVVYATSANGKYYVKFDDTNAPRYNAGKLGVAAGNTDTANAAAINAIVAGSTGGIVIDMPRGIVRSKKLTFPRSSIVFQGRGDAESKLILTDNPGVEFNAMPELMVNGDFATGDMTGWTKVSGDDPTFTTPLTATVTITIASPGVISWTTHNRQPNEAVKFSTTVALPTGLTAGTTYYVKTVLSANTFTVSATPGGAAIATTGTQSGTHTISTVLLSIDMDVTAKNIRWYQDITVPANTPVSISMMSDSGSGIFLYLYEGGGFSTSLTGGVGIISTKSVGPGYVTSSTGSIRVYLYTPTSSATMKISYVTAAVASTAYYCVFRNMEIGQTNIAGTFMKVGASNYVVFEDCLCDGTIGKLVEAGDAIRTPSYLRVRRMKGLAANVPVPFIDLRSGVNFRASECTVFPQGGIYDPSTATGGVIAGRSFVRNKSVWPELWDTVVKDENETFGWDKAQEVIITAGASSQSTAVGPIEDFDNVYDSCKENAVDYQIGASCYLKEARWSDNYYSVLKGIGQRIRGAGAVRILKHEGNRGRGHGTSGIEMTVTKVTLARFSGELYDLDLTESGNAKAMLLTGSASWKGVVIDGIYQSDEMFIDYFPSTGGARIQPQYGLVVTGNIDGLVITQNNRFLGDTANFSLSGSYTNSSISDMIVGLNPKATTLATTTSPLTINTGARKAEIHVLGSYSSVDKLTNTVTPVVGALGPGTTTTEFRMGINDQAKVYWSGGTAPTIVMIER